MRILIISCSLSPGSRSRVLAADAARVLKTLDVEVEILDLRHHAKMPFCDGEDVDDCVLEPLAGYDYTFLDCPPSISLVSESVFEAADALLVPIIPATLSSRTLDQLHGVLGKGPQVFGFFSMADRRKKLHRELHPKGFNVLGFPSNDFGGQEPGTAEEIQTFCKLTYDVTFPMFEKVVTQLSANQSPVYGFLWTSGYLPSWNFAKYVIGKKGEIVAFFPSKVTPEDPTLRAAITKALAQ